MKKTKVTNGKFFRIQTPNGNEFIIYIKYSDKLIKNDIMVSGFMWEFSLTDIEKDKRYVKTRGTPAPNASPSSGRSAMC